ncbi:MULTISPECIES: hypothetical protein [unclassified Corynebacterium]|uniref:hypothetical protein n=1 Tax=unclassified Corynebacterium TaxID=2624378 RepID=UPI001EF74CD5|nr:MULTISPECIES: hypothetical protein [unclassified Corynebacterium]MCG7258468.1 hypothetical protein [Corynebacterium sp. ACRQK]MCG7263013.1 hypothetical protein [Corynebacterium sp. ACRQL]
MKFKKSLITLAAASSVALAGVPAAVADDAAEAPVAADAATQPATDEAAAEDATEGEDQAEADDEAEAGDEGSENEGSEDEGSTEGSIDSEKKEKLKGSIDKLAGWDDSTSTLDKIKDVIGFIGKIVKTFAGIPGSN